MAPGTSTRDRGVRPSSTRLEEIQRLAGIGHWQWHVPTNVVTWSSEQHHLFGVEEGSFEPTYEAWMEAIHPDDREMAGSAVGAAFENHHGWAFDHRVVRPDGAVVWLHCRGEADVQDGEVQRMVGVSMDITDRIATERYLRDFVSSASHELRTPVTSIYQAIDLLQTGMAGDREGELLDVIGRQAARLRELTTDLLDLSALDEPGTTIMLGPVSVADVVAEVVAGRTEDVEVLVPAELLVLGDRASLARIVVNLVENAFTHGQAPVRVTAASQADEVELHVTDAGEGVPAHLRGEVFTPFVGSGAGSGLGLALVRRLATSMAGSVGYTTEDGGARFTVRLSAP